MTLIKLKATGLVAALVTALLGLVAIALYGTTPLAAEIADALKIISGILAGGLVIDLGFVAHREKSPE